MFEAGLRPAYVEGVSNLMLGDSVWYESDAESVAGLLGAEATRLLHEDEGRLANLERNLQMYGGTRARCIRPWQSPLNLRGSVEGAWNADKLRLNVVRAATDTVTAKVGKLRPRPTFLTDGGDWSTQRRAKNLQRFMDGAYHQADVYELSMDCFRDAMVLGTGVIHPYADGQRVAAERVPCWELFVDRADGLYGKPRCLLRIKWVARNQISSLYPGHESADVDPTTKTYDTDVVGAVREGYVRVIEAWCLPVCPQDEIGQYDKRSDAKHYDRDYCAHHGRHVVLVGAGVACDEDWACREFPFTFLYWSKPQQGFWGDAAIKEVFGLQVEINKLLQFIQEAMQKTAQPFVMRRKGAIITPAEVTNLVAQVYDVETDGGPLSEAFQIVSFQSVHPQVMQHLWMLYSKAFEILGSNQLAASASAPPGLESGRALEQLAEEHSERFMTVSRHFEYVFGEATARQLIRVAKEIDASLKAAGKAEGYVIRAPNGRATIKLKWQDVEIDEDGFIIQVFPTSVLPTTPAARIQEVERMAAAQWVSPTEARRMLDFPDLRADTDLATADHDNLMRQLELMLEDGQSVQPEPYQDLAEAIRVAQQSILRAQAEGAPEDHIDLVRDFISLAEGLLKRTQVPNPAPPVGAFSAAPAGAPPGAPNAVPPGATPTI